MARDKNIESEISAIRADIADLVKSISRLESEVGHTRRGRNGNGNGNGQQHHITDDLMAGATRLGGEAAEAAGEAVHIGASWIDDMLRKNPTPAVFAALGIGFVLGVMGRR
jgi:hypothetical protein